VQGGPLQLKRWCCNKLQIFISWLWLVAAMVLMPIAHAGRVGLWVIEYVFNSFLLPPGTSDDSSRFCLKFSSLSNVLFTCKPWRGRPPEPWPTTALHPTPSPYKHIGRLPLLTTFIGGLRGVLGATISLCQTIASSTVHLWAHLMHRWTNGHNLGLFNRCKPPNNSLG
jgi:hypothetical protein